MGSFVRSCRNCGEAIEMSDKEGGRWLPFNENGTKHFCHKDSRRQAH